MQLISDEYRELNKKLHHDNKNYGTSGAEYLQYIRAIYKGYQTQDILDYGCGKGTLANNLPFSIKQYDPAIEKYKELPTPSDFIVCTDVLEHIEPQNLDNVLLHIKSLMKKVGLLSAATREAKKILSDGRNAHLIVQKPLWWINKLSEYFDIISFEKAHNHILFIVRPLEK